MTYLTVVVGLSKGKMLKHQCASVFQVKKGIFSNMLQLAQDKAWGPSIVKGAFKRTGIFPIDPDRVDEKWLARETEANTQQGVFKFKSITKM